MTITSYPEEVLQLAQLVGVRAAHDHFFPRWQVLQWVEGGRMTIVQVTKRPPCIWRVTAEDVRTGEAVTETVEAAPRAARPKGEEVADDPA